MCPSSQFCKRFWSPLLNPKKDLLYVEKMLGMHFVVAYSSPIVILPLISTDPSVVTLNGVLRSAGCEKPIPCRFSFLACCWVNKCLNRFYLPKLSFDKVGHTLSKGFFYDSSILISFVCLNEPAFRGKYTKKKCRFFEHTCECGPSS